MVMVDKYFYKREKVANLLFDLVKYLLTALGATLLFTDKDLSTGQKIRQDEQDEQDYFIFHHGKS